jgi:hypothetical protein
MVYISGKACVNPMLIDCVGWSYLLVNGSKCASKDNNESR